MSSKKFIRNLVVLTAVCSLGLAGCSKGDEAKNKAAKVVKTTATSVAKETVTSKATATSTVMADSDKLSAENFHLHEGFVKATKPGKTMTAIFGVLENHTSKPVHLVGFTSTDVKAKKFEIHEVVGGKMQEKKDGITIPAGGKHFLKPGHDHLMIMGLTQAIEPGSKINVTLKFEDGQTVTIKDIPARAIGAGNESYGDDMKNMDHKDGMKMNGKDMDMNKKDKKDMDMDKKDSSK